MPWGVEISQITYIGNSMGANLELTAKNYALIGTFIGQFVGGSCANG